MTERGRLCDHPAISGKHVVTMTRAYPDGVAWSVATCQCGWTARELVTDVSDRFRRTKTEGFDPDDDAVRAHWRDVAKAEKTRA